MTDFNAQSKVSLCNKAMSFEEFARDYAGNNFEKAVVLARQLVDTGALKFVDAPKTAQQKAVQTALRQEEIREQVFAFEDMQEQAKDAKAMAKREGRASYQRIEVNVPNMYVGQQYAAKFQQDLRLQYPVDVTFRDGQTMLVFYNITDAELNYIQRVYVADKVIDGAVGLVDKGAQTVTGAVDYTAKKIVSPLAQIGAKSAVSILRTAVNTMVRTGSTLVTATSQGAKKTADEIRTDPEILRARNELNDARNAVVRGLGNMGSTVPGIRIVQ